MEELLTFYTVVLILAWVDGWLAGLAVIIRLISAELASSWDVAELDNKKLHKNTKFVKKKSLLVPQGWLYI